MNEETKKQIEQLINQRKEWLIESLVKFCIELVEKQNTDLLLFDFCKWLCDNGYKINGYDDGQLTRIIELYQQKQTI
jgi:hypothetical protein